MAVTISPDSDGWAWVMNAIRIACVLFVAAVALCGCASGSERPVAGGVSEPREFDSTVTLDGRAVRVYVADDRAELSEGLQGYEPLDDGEGMLFVFDDVAVRTFAMKDVAFPIDVVFIAEDLTVSAIEPLDPGDTRLVSSPGPSPYVIELPQGWAAANGVAVGSTLEVVE
jgi:uncharacterized membrane protein (UPF0127 family)